MKRSLPQLVRVALRHWGRDRSWAAIHELRMRGSPDVLALAQMLSRSRNARRRALGLHIAAQLRQRRGGDSVAYAVEQTQALLLNHLHDPHREVVEAAVSGLGHRPHPGALANLVELASHRSADVRFSVAFALGGYAHPEAIGALLRLAGDADDDVRDWATFGLGSLHDAEDTPEIRDLLAQKLGDANVDVRGEAVMGLAVRGDARAMAHLLGLGPEDWRSLDLNAAERLASPRLRPALEALLRDAQGRTDIDAGWLGALGLALQACGGPEAAG